MVRARPCAPAEAHTDLPTACSKKGEDFESWPRRLLLRHGDCILWLCRFPAAGGGGIHGEASREAQVPEAEPTPTQATQPPPDRGGLS